MRLNTLGRKAGIRWESMLPLFLLVQNVEPGIIPGCCDWSKPQKQAGRWENIMKQANQPIIETKKIQRRPFFWPIKK